MQKLPEHIRQRRKRIEEIIKDLDKAYSGPIPAAYSKFCLPRAVALLSEPELVHILPFPFDDMEAPAQFIAGTGDGWRYVGREKFTELLRELNLVLNEKSYRRLWVYGTRGYGKSHLLAALVCYLSALGERVIYIPDCRTWLDSAVGVFRTAMLFTFNDKATQDEILKLDTKKEIEQFLTDMEKRKGPILFVIDQMNEISLKASDPEYIRLAKINLSTWISALLAERKAVLSSSSNNEDDYLREGTLHNNSRIMRVYGGLTEVG